MRLIEIPSITLEEEIDNLRTGADDVLGSTYAAGAIDAIKWIIDRKISPSEWILRRNMPMKDCVRPH